MPRQHLGSEIGIQTAFLTAVIFTSFVNQCVMVKLASTEIATRVQSVSGFVYDTREGKYQFRILFNPETLPVPALMRLNHRVQI